MALLTDLLSANTTDIAANATAVASAGGRHKYVGTVEVTNSSTSFLEVDSTYITADYDDYFVRVVTPNWGWSGSTTTTGFFLEGYGSTQGWIPPKGKGRALKSNSSSIFEHYDAQILTEVILNTTQPSGTGKDVTYILDVHLNRPLIAGQCTTYYSCVGVDNGPALVQSRGGQTYNYGYNESFNNFRFFSQYNWPTSAKAYVYGIVDS